MKAGNMQFGSKSAVRIWLGMLAPGGQQKGALRGWLACISIHVKTLSSKLHVLELMLGCSLQRP